SADPAPIESSSRRSILIPDMRASPCQFISIRLFIGNYPLSILHRIRNAARRGGPSCRTTGVYVTLTTINAAERYAPYPVIPAKAGTQKARAVEGIPGFPLSRE